VKAVCMIVLAAALASYGCGRAETPAAGDAAASVPSRAPGTAAIDAAPLAQAEPAPPEYVEVTVPAGTALSIALRTAVASDTSRVEDRMRGELRSSVTVDGREVVPAGAPVEGIVTAAVESGRVKGRARLAFEFTSLTVGGERYELRTKPVDTTAPATKGEDATKIAIGAGAGAAVGGLLGGKKGAAKGAAVGGGAGTGVVLATKGEEVRFDPNDRVSTSLAVPLTIRVRPN
jgi:hypothetical protein